MLIIVFTIENPDKNANCPMITEEFHINQNQLKSSLILAFSSFTGLIG